MQRKTETIHNVILATYFNILILVEHTHSTFLANMSNTPSTKSCLRLSFLCVCWSSHTSHTSEEYTRQLQQESASYAVCGSVCCALTENKATFSESYFHELLRLPSIKCLELFHIFVESTCIANGINVFLPPVAMHFASVASSIF